jgi:hypothetical protein
VNAAGLDESPQIVGIRPACACQALGMLPRVLKALDRLDLWPNVSGAKPLRGELAGHYRLRVGDWRIVFRVREEMSLS